MNSNYSKLKNFVNETKSGSSSANGLSDAKNTVFDFFNKSVLRKDINTTSPPLETNDQTDTWFKEADNDPFCPKLTKTQRIIGFMICLLMGVFCMSLASLYIPVIVLKSRKFVLLFSLGSLFFIASFSILWGVKSHLKHLFNIARLPFTLSYFSTLFATIYYAMIVKSVLITLLFAVLQIGTLIWYVVSYIPGGQKGLTFFSKMFYSLASKTVQTTLQV
ncbi:transport SFT2-like [Brachionus plicatilis]|uniref:Vesicle transport protein n=1 Tax=Brachionus plicatilis TaxID=10195 RepID=A0A3M7SFZ0_BRAPC|nr:transport SFT2-like [Brachionus plicatilis]